MNRRRDVHAVARRKASVPLNLSAFSATALICLAVVLVGIPVLRVPAGLILLVGVQGVAGTAAVLPVHASRRGFTVMAVVVGTILAILEGALLNLVGVPLTQLSIAMTAFTVSLVLLAVAGVRRTIPDIMIDSRSFGSGALLVGGMAAMVAVAVLVGGRIPVTVDAPFSSMVFAGELASVSGVVERPVGTVLPVVVKVSNNTRTERSYTLRLTGQTPGPQPVTAKVVSGAVGQVKVGDLKVEDGCLRRYTVTATGADALLLTLYVKGTGEECRQ